jgi:hypothetical protein
METAIHTGFCIIVKNQSIVAVESALLEIRE